MVSAIPVSRGLRILSERWSDSVWMIEAGSAV